MGRYGQPILTIVGTVVGAYFGYPGLGAFLGSLAGSLLFPTKLPTQVGPRLADITTTQSTVGAPIPRGWGTFPAAGNIIAQTDLREVIQTDEVGGKGAPSQTTQTPAYFQDFAIGLNGSNLYGKGGIGGIRRIWANGKPIYDLRPPQAGESDADYQKRSAASATLASQMVIYLGTENQLPDPTLEAFYGVGNISAFRGLAYVVFVNWQNKVEDGNRMPSQWKFEVFSAGNETDSATTYYAQEILYDWIGGNDPTVPRGTYQYGVLEDLSSVVTVFTFDTLEEAVNHSPIPNGRSYLFNLGVAAGGASLLPFGGGWAGTGDYLNTEPSGNRGFVPNDDMVSHQDQNVCWVHMNFSAPTVFGESRRSDVCSNQAQNSEFYLPPGVVFHNFDGVYLTVGINPLPSGHPIVPVPWDDPDASGHLGSCGSGFNYFGFARDVIIRIQRFPSPPADVCDGRPSPEGAPDYCITVDGTLAKRQPWSKVNGNFHVLQKFVGGDNAAPTVYPLGPVLPVGDLNDTREFWEANYKAAIVEGHIANDLVYGVDYPALQGYAYVRTNPGSSIDTLPASVAQVVLDLCEEGGLAASQIDVSSLANAALTVQGFVRTGVMTARAAIDPLRQACFFDPFESEAKGKFVVRGGPIVRTFSKEDLGWSNAGDDATTALSSADTDDSELPHQVMVQYISQSRDYDAGQQLSPARVESKAVNDQSIQLPIVLEDDQAAQIAAVLWQDAWDSRWTHGTSLDAENQDLEGADAIAVPVDGVLTRMRITAITDNLPSVRKVDISRDKSATYISSSVATVPPFTPPKLNIFGPIEAIMLDLPLLRDQDNDAGFYVGFRPFMTDNFRGVGLYRSTDGGGNYTKVGEAGSSATTGTLVQSLPVAEPEVWDYGTTLYIDIDNGSVESTTAEAVIEGANAAAIGADGRWEIIQFQTAELVALNRWALSGLLRGRRGTEWAIGSSQVGDRFVLISGNGIIRVPQDVSAIGRAAKYRAVGVGTSLEATDTQDFTGHGTALLPFSVCHVAATRNQDGDFAITWVRRGRIGQTLQSGVDIALSEAAEDYEVDILKGSTVVRTLSVNSQGCSYLADDQIIDFGDKQNSAHIVIYQISSAVGRGYPTDVTVSPPLPPGDPLVATFEPNSAGLDHPMTLIYNAAGGKFILARTGKRAAAAVLGLYEWDGSATPVNVFDTYDGRNGFEGNYIPLLYTDTARHNMETPYPTMSSDGSDGFWALMWGNQNIGDFTGELGRWLVNHNATSGQIKLIAHDQHPVTDGGAVAMTRASSASRYIEATAGTSKAWSSVNGETSWGGNTNLTGSFTTGFAKLVPFGGNTFALTNAGLNKNTANDLVAWTSVNIGVDNATYTGWLFTDIVADATAILIMMEATKVSDGLTYNILIRSTDASTWSIVRSVEKSVDHRSGGPLIAMKWEVIVPYGAGWIIYGRDGVNATLITSPGVFPQYIKSTDHGATWGAVSYLDTGDVTDNSILINAVSDGARVVAAIDNGDGPSHTVRICTSTDGATFTPVSF